MSIEPTTPIVPTPTLAAARDPQKVYERAYTHRRSNPLERQLDSSSQDLLAKAFPGYTRRVHLTFDQGRVLVRPAAG